MSTTPNVSSPPTPTPTLTSTSDDIEKLLNELPKVRYFDATVLCRWKGLWITPKMLRSALTFISSFHARDDDVLLASTIKTGTTWLKALSLCIIHKNHQTDPHKHNDILTRGNPHLHVPTVEAIVSYAEAPPIDPYDASAPRLVHTHLPYAVLPDSIKNSACKIVYICRNPKDTLVSMWHFSNHAFRSNQDPYPLEKIFESFCSGVHPYGSFFDHVAEYWNESQKRPQNILFLKYEELKSDPRKTVSKIAEFLGRPLENEKEVDEVLWRCSLERLKNLEVNNGGNTFRRFSNKSFFRKGEVGDWKNYLTQEMEERIDQISRTKFEPLGLYL